MRTKLIALALAAMLAIGSGGIVAASSTSSGPDAQAHTHSTPTASSTVVADGYEFTVSDIDDWFTGDRADDYRTVASLIVHDDEAGDRLRGHFGTDDQLQMDVYGALQTDDDSAHVRIHPDEPSAYGDPRPLLELTVDLDARTVDVVGVSTDPVEPDAVRTDAESVQLELNTTEPSADGLVTTTRTDAVRSAGDPFEIDVPAENSTTTGDTISFDLSDNGTDGAAQSDGTGIEIVDEHGELTDAERDRVRALVANDTAARAMLDERFDGAVELAVDGVEPSGDVVMDATAPGTNPETVVVAGLSDGDVSVESATLVTADPVSIDLDDENYTVRDPADG